MTGVPRDAFCSPTDRRRGAAAGEGVARGCGAAAQQEHRRVAVVAGDIALADDRHQHRGKIHRDRALVGFTGLTVAGVKAGRDAADPTAAANILRQCRHSRLAGGGFVRYRVRARLQRFVDRLKRGVEVVHLDEIVLFPPGELVICRFFHVLFSFSVSQGKNFALQL